MDKAKKQPPNLPPQPKSGSTFAEDNDPVYIPITLDDQPEPKRPD